MDHYERIMDAVNFIKKNCPMVPRVGVVLGSGLGEFADQVTENQFSNTPTSPISRK